jgi:ribonuclease P protein component
LRPLARLQRARDFQRLFREGRRYRGRLLTLVVRPGAPEEPLRAAPICSKKVGGAVVRNRIKRRFREILRLAPWQSGTVADLAVIAHPPAAEANFAALEAELSVALRRAGLTAEATGDVR